MQHLYRSRDLLTVMSVEDAMVGIWLLGINKVSEWASMLSAICWRCRGVRAHFIPNPNPNPN